ncbi:MAG TPA: Dyp-type peroxidase [Thermoanaerobaculia bacterium]|nr:Dyp-type peroxidase [Thermoanaerobaculia bacterium]
MTVLAGEPDLEAEEIQGNVLRGFDTNHQELLGFTLDDPPAARPWLAGLADRIASLERVHDYRLRRTAGDPATTTEVLVNAAFSRRGLDALELRGTDVGDGFFNLAMGSLAGSLGDRREDYVIGRDRESTPDLLLLLGCQEDETLTAASRLFQEEAGAAGLRRIYQERGHLLPGEVEHFGYRDGISQVGPRGLLPGDPPQPLTLRLDPSDPRSVLEGERGQRLVWPGQFVFGYATQGEDPITPGPIATGTDWMRNGSLLVFRRLRQDVAAFRQFLAETAQELTGRLGLTVTDRDLGAQVVGRWEDGTPVTLSPEGPDPAISGDPRLLNTFGYAADAQGQRCPFFAHIRKVNPRDLQTDQGPATRTLQFQMLRRGIPYGPHFEPGTEAEDRGLLFLAYQTSFMNQFQLLNKLWMNNSRAPEKEAGHDLLVGQDELGGARFGALLDPLGNERARFATRARWVVPTGGAFLFSPSLGFFRRLAG